MKKRKVVDSIVKLTIIFTGVFVIAILGIVFGYIFIKGISHFNIDFFIRLPKPVGEPHGGMVNAIVGSFILVGIALLWSVPISIMTGIYIAEYGKEKKYARIIDSLLDILAAIPSIVIGIYAYAIMVKPIKTFSAISGAFALGIIILPVVAKTTKEMLLSVPKILREAGWSLGLNNFRTIVFIVLKTAKPGIITGILISLARIFGETAPLLFTAFGNRFWHRGLLSPIAALPLQIFVYAISPFEDWNNQAWLASLVLVVIVFSITILSRKLMSKYKG